MGKLSWNDLRLIYEGQFGVTADEANKWIAKELFTKNWYGTQKQPGRMWEDIENCISFSELVIEVEKFQKKRVLKQEVAIEVMLEEKHIAWTKFASDIKRPNLLKLKTHSINNYYGMWKKQLLEAGFLTKKEKEQTYSQKQVIESQLKQEKRQRELDLVIELTKKIKANRGK